MARSWLSVEEERIAELAAARRRGEKLPMLPEEPEDEPRPKPRPKRHEPPRWQEVRDLQNKGLCRRTIAELMGIGEHTVRYYQGEIRAREDAVPYREQGSAAQTELMAKVYPRGDERRDWIRREMALRDELIECKLRRNRRQKEGMQ